MFLTFSTAWTFQARPGHFPVAASSFCGPLKQAQEAFSGGASRGFAGFVACGNAVEPLAGARDLQLVAGGPFAERRDRNQEIAAKRGQRIVDPRRNGRKYRAGDQPVAFE